MNSILIPAHNPSPMTGRGNNTYLIASRGSALLVDAGIGERAHLAAVDAALAGAEARLELVVVTHGHGDHVSGVPAIARAHPGAAFAKYDPREEAARYGIDWRALSDDEDVSAGGETLRVLHTPGHSLDHIVLWHEPTAAVFTGDLVVPGSSVMIHWSRGGNLADYLASLERVLALAPRTLFPAHGSRVDDPRAVLTGYLEHRHMRERQVIDALSAGHATVQAIADCIYHGLNPALMPAARENVRAHLEKLKADGRATDQAGRWTL